MCLQGLLYYSNTFNKENYDFSAVYIQLRPSVFLTEG